MTPRLLVLVLITFQLFGCYVVLDSFLHHQRDVPGCQMSYSRPSFIPIHVPHSRLADKYSLYLYREGGIDPDNQLLGVPTLFIPGHAGSYKQARSIAAESAYYYQSLSLKDFRYGLDVFTVDLNEEFSAVAGRLLYDQAEYLNDAIKHILHHYQSIAEYQRRPVPASVIVVGHSMGGVVARIMQHLPNYVPGTINTIFTLATPHSMPPIVLDPSIDMIYQRHLSQPLNDTMLISVAGGTLDTIVNSDAAILSPSMGLTVYTTAIPGVWTGCDHMAILWCNQLVKKVAAALVDIVDIRSPSQTAPLDKQRHIFENYLAPTPSLRLASVGTSLTLSTGAIHIDQKEQQLFTLSDQQLHQQLVYYFGEENDCFGILTNVQDLNVLSIQLCHHGDTADLTCFKVESGFQMIPSFRNGKTHPHESDTSPYWLLDLDHTTWKEFDLVIVDYYEQQQQQKTLANGQHPFIRLGMYKTGMATRQRANPSLFDLAFGGGSLLEVDTLGTILQFPDIDSPLLAFKLSMISRSSPNTATVDPLLIRQAFYGESKFHILGPDTFAPIHLHRGPDDGSSSKDGLILTIWSSHDETVQLLLELDWYGSVGKSVLRLGPVIPMCLFLVSLSFLAHQLSCDSSFARYSSVDSLAEWMGGYSFSYLYVVVIIVSGLQQWWPLNWAMGGAPSLSLPPFLWWLPLSLFMLSTGLFLVLVVILSLLIYGLQWLLPVSLSTHRFGYTTMSIRVLLFSCLGWLPVSVVVVLVYLQWLFLCAASYASAKLSNTSQDWSRYRVLFAIFMVLTTWLPYHIPDVVVYIRDLMVGWKFSASVATLLNDVPTLIELFLLFIIGLCDIMLESRGSCLLVARILYVFTVYYILVGIQYPFSLHHFVNAIIA
ncbi:PGAP1-like protein-domain-containing protein [Chlamydoabsidia padenii]|nr:PGAP1-like protein-domain-containing protein [Chlamydoabsidia padenii]